MRITPFLRATFHFILAQEFKHQIALFILALAIIAATSHLFHRTNDVSSSPAVYAPSIKKPMQIPEGSVARDAAILSLFQPSKEELIGRTREDILRERFRNLYTGVFLLKECGVNVSTYHTKLSQDFTLKWSSLALTGQTPITRYRTLQSIIEEARSSYVLLYKNTPCRNRNLDAFEAYFSQLP